MSRITLGDVEFDSLLAGAIVLAVVVCVRRR